MMQKRHEALNEIMQAAMMGPHKVSPKVHAWLVRTKDIMVTSQEEFSRPRFQRATVALRIAAIDQALGIIEGETVEMAVRTS